MYLNKLYYAIHRVIHPMNYGKKQLEANKFYLKALMAITEKNVVSVGTIGHLG